MSLARGKFGIEWNPRQREHESSGLGWLFALVAVVALVSLAWTLVARIRAARADREQAVVAAESSLPAPAGVTASAEPGGERLRPSPAPPPVRPEAIRQRTPLVGNLLMRLEAAESKHDVEMAASTIETLRALPGSPAADLDDALAHRLGALNVIRLFERKSRLWVKEVTVRRGDSASRIAYENGTTLASVYRLNGGSGLKVILGRKLYVLDRPQPTLVIHRSTQKADLTLKDRFFKRYDLTGEVTGQNGQYTFRQPSGAFWKQVGARFKSADAAELEILMPAGTLVIVSET